MAAWRAAVMSYGTVPKIMMARHPRSWSARPRRDGMFDLPDYPSKSQGGFQHTSDVSTRSVGFAWIASMSLHSEDIGHATDCAEDAEGSRRDTDTAVTAAMPAAVHTLAGGLRAWHGR
jgi:hypothetical protein